MHGFGSGRCRQPGNHSTDGRKIEMPAYYRRHEAALAPQSEQVWVGLSLTPQSVTADSPAFRNGRCQLPPLGLPHEGVERALEQLTERKTMRGGDRRELLLHAR